MKKVFMSTLIILGAMVFMMQNALAKPPTPKPPKAAKMNAVSRLAHAGDITGTLEGVCSTTFTLQGMVMVYLPGTSFAAYPDSEGNFTIYNVPAGTYDLLVETDGDLATAEAEIRDFEVIGKTVNKVEAADFECLPTVK
jgi:hypothetical protein